MPLPDAPPPPRSPAGAGAPFVLLLMIGTIVGALLGQTTIGFLVGTAAGIAVAVAMGWAARR